MKKTRRKTPEIMALKQKIAVDYLVNQEWNQTELARKYGVTQPWINKFIREELCGKWREYWNQYVEQYVAVHKYFGRN